jgi:hypothetical protein
MIRYCPRTHCVVVTALLLPVLALAGLTLADFLRIGRTPAPCAGHAKSNTIALVLSGGAKEHRTRHAVGLYQNGRVDRIAFSGAGYGGDAADNLARVARRLGGPIPICSS